MNKRRAFITGIAGQDGSYLTELLLEKEYDVYGLVKYSTTNLYYENINHLMPFIEVVEGDITDSAQMNGLLAKIKPHEVYNLAAQSHVGTSFKMPELTAQVTGIGPLKLLEAIRASGFNSKFYQASTSELYGNSTTKLLDENVPFSPVSPYGCAKLFAHHIACNYRISYNMFVCCGILFNHESPRRGENFVTRKIIRGAATAKSGSKNKLALGNMDARRDWGHAKDYVRGMWLMMQHSVPDDYVLASGTSYSVRDFAEMAFNAVGLDYNDFVYVDPLLYRPTDVNVLVGSAKKAENILGWKPEYDLKQLIEDMTLADSCVWAL